ncbi:hypothetical protein PIB30_048767 [Stylosanthes scabra]|uniref:Uncharacterized protein n=1 Tax=Stylosanthes scabra TaxID=79078 RepID=A0ABU6THS9_9FABA|nr:hypothetical protein [Stylosanthes scabra]
MGVPWAPFHDRESAIARSREVDPVDPLMHFLTHGLTYEGLLWTYNEGAGDVDGDLTQSIVDQRIAVERQKKQWAVEMQKKQGTMAWTVLPNHMTVLEDTWKIVDDLEILIKRLKMKQTKDEKLKGEIERKRVTYIKE